MVGPAHAVRKFSKKEIAQLFLVAKRVIRQSGLDILLAASLSSVGRLLIVTPAKIGTAPDRNRIRRRLKALFFEKNFSSLPFDCVIIVKSAGINLEYHQLEALFNKAYQKIQACQELDVSP